MEKTAVQLALPETAEEVAIYTNLVQPKRVHIDELCRSTGLSTGLVSSTLTLMELKGLVQQVGGMNYVLCREPSAGYHVKKAVSDQPVKED